MNEPKELLTRINDSPDCLADIGWREATDSFSPRRIEEIIVGITDDEVCNKAGEFIVLEWYETCENESLSRYIPLDAHEWYGRLQKMGIAGMYDEDVDFVSEQVEGWKLRYCHIEAENDNGGVYHYRKSIERVIDEAKEKRRRINDRKKRKQELAEKVKRLHGVRLQDKGEEEGEQIKKLRQELHKAQEAVRERDEAICGQDKEIARQKEGIKRLHEAICGRDKEISLLNEEIRQQQSAVEGVESRAAQARTEAIRELVEHLITYAERFPSNQNDKAFVIREALLMKSHNGYIPTEALNDELNDRLKNLGCKESGMQVDTLSTQGGPAILGGQFQTGVEFTAQKRIEAK